MKIDIKNSWKENEKSTSRGWWRYANQRKYRDNKEKKNIVKIKEIDFK